MVQEAKLSPLDQAIHPLREYKVDASGVTNLKLNFHVGQKRAWDSRARFVAVISGTQAGKTSFAPHWLQREIHERGPGDYLYVTSTFTLLDKKALPEFREVFESRGKLGKYHSGFKKFVFSEAGMRWIHKKCDNNDCPCHLPGRNDFDALKPTTVFFGHANNAESLESATAKAAVCDEAGQEDFKLESWEAVLRRLAIHEGRVLIPTTPYNWGWLKTEVYDRWKAGDTDYEVINFASDMNPIFPKAEMARAKRTMPKWKFEMFYLGLFTRPAGLIYDTFESDYASSLTALSSNLIKPFPIPMNWHRVIGIDFGGINTAALKFALHPTSPFFVCYEEYYPRVHRSSAEHACWIMEHEPTVTVDWRTSKARPVPTLTYRKSLYTIVAGALNERQWRTEISSSGLEVHPTLLREVELGIDRVYSTVQQCWFKLFDTCRHALSEFGSYSREIDGEGNPIPGTIVNKAKYHCLDAIRYGVSLIADPNRVAEWTEDDIRVLHPDVDAELEELLDSFDDDVNLDSPRVRRLLERREALMYKPHYGQGRIIDVEPEN